MPDSNARENDSYTLPVAHSCHIHCCRVVGPFYARCERSLQKEDRRHGRLVIIKIRTTKGPRIESGQNLLRLRFCQVRHSVCMVSLTRCDLCGFGVVSEVPAAEALRPSLVAVHHLTTSGGPGSSDFRQLGLSGLQMESKFRRYAPHMIFFSIHVA